MGKLAFIFPGQGSQHPGMGQSVHEAYPESRTVFEQATRLLGYSMEDLCFSGPEDRLRQTGFTQPALLATSIALFAALQSRGVEPDACAGHSLGEYSALVAAGCLPLETALTLVSERGRLMAGADPDGKGGMAAVIGLDPDALQGVLQSASAAGRIEAANYNCPGQVVISGDKTAIDAAEAPANEAGAANFVKLEVSGAFHSSLMEGAARAFRPTLEAAAFCAGKPVVSNVTAAFADPAEMADLLVRQIHSPVRWEESIRFLAAQGFDRFVEIGPKKVLCGLLRRIDRGLKTWSVEDAAGIDKLLTEIGG